MMMTKRIFILICGCASMLNTFAQPYTDASLSAEERAKDLMDRLTLKEKAQLMR